MDAKEWSTSPTISTARTSKRSGIAGRFAEFYLDYGLATIAWHHGADFAPDYLYEKLSAMH